jgi:pimeloyl-ACP methyl ester carboxylesterase
MMGGLRAARGRRMLVAGWAYTSGSVTSADGTVIGYRQAGRGAPLVLLHGGMQTAQSFSQLAAALADDFSVYVPDRRGRGASGPNGPAYGVAREVEDLTALLAHTGAAGVFGLSSGAIIALRTALVTPGLRRLAIYEPPLSLDHSTYPAWVTRFDREVAAGDLAAALVTVMKGTGDTSFFSQLPRWLTVPLLRLGLRAQAGEAAPGEAPLAALVPTMHYDAQIVIETEATLESFGAVTAEVLLLGGSRSAGYLKAALRRLSEVLPHAQRHEFRGYDHVAAANDGHPAEVAQVLRRFFAAP